jgi:hypothetical protein
MAEKKSNWFNGSILDSQTSGWLEERRKSSQASIWKQEKRSWITLQSGAREDGNTIGADINAKSTKWNLKGIYKAGTFTEDNTGTISAAPSVTGVTSTTTGTAGSMRKAEVKFKVYSYAQLKKAQKAFFVPGMSAAVLWGWNIKQDGTPVNPNIVVYEKKSIADITMKIHRWRKKNDGCTDGMCGVISDFKWSKTQGAGADSKGFDCSITIDSVSKSYVSGPVTVPTEMQCGCPPSSEDNESKARGGWIRQALKTQAESEMSQEEMIGKVWKNDKGVIMGVSANFDQDYNKEETGEEE